MKQLRVTIQLELAVPDDWEIVPTSEGTQVLKLPDGQYLDLAVEPLFASDPEDLWRSTEDEDVLDNFLEMVENEDVRYTFVQH
ncbi:hypothetical protein AZ34_14235 [Hylemonella gracilis str. Niagara R]|uniref:Uncharacterized protein n=1 Tax=Hylemonella gracilis str. Niagara R TaxID=1458275 RepID=A0A016XKP0_9BURK|nr:hypothetical protein [Hylemonella gracilis]EYC52107.1 hypothetical protein AZ34_14235 [Hylemonella gracilis str. Niagara R]